VTVSPQTQETALKSAALRRVSVGVGVAMVALFGLMSVASAFSSQMTPGDFDAACTAASGTAAGSGAGRTCTVTIPGGDTEVETVPAGESGRGWNATVTTSDTVTVYTWNNAGPGGVSSNTTGGDSEVTGCTNPGGQEMDLEHQNCQLP